MEQIWRTSGAAEGGEDRNEWQGIQLKLNIETESRLVFEASVGQKELGNIAIDDVSFTPSCM